MLEQCRVLDLTDERGQLAAQILAGLGADVVLVEPLEGSSARAVEPFAGNEPGPERSLFFWGYNRGKRAIALDLGTASGQSTLQELATHYDVLIESGAAPVDLAELRRADPTLITVSISAFGSSGPKAAWPATDLTIMAASGQMALTGDADRAPLRTTVPQAFLHAATDAAVGALLALTERSRRGRGQHVEVSAQRSVSFAAQSHLLASPLGAPEIHRTSGGIRVGDVDVQFVWPCKDGHVVITLMFGSSVDAYTGRLMDWLHETGYVDDAVRDTDWSTYGAHLFGGSELVEHYQGLKAAVTAFCRERTMQELLEGAVARQLLMAPTATPVEIAASAQLEARGFWDTVADPELGPRPLRAPGRFVHTTAASPAPLGRAPRLDEHRDQVLGETRVRRAGGLPLPSAAASPRRSPLDGVRVIDLTWALSGPATARWLGDFGATVVHIESSHRLDAARTVQPYLHNETAPENAGVYLNISAGKLGLSLNLGCDEGRRVLDDLIGWTDVLIESFSPRGRASLGLDYDRLQGINPDLIMMSTCLFGQDGPLRTYAGYGTTGAAMSGFYALTGWPDRAPAGPFGAYTDYVSPRFALCSLLAALDHRARTGEGQYLDFAQAEAAMHFLTPALLDQEVNGHVAVRRGNDDAVMAPHGVYPCAGDDRWVAIACRGDADWRALCGLLTCPELIDLDAGERRHRRRALDAIVTRWTGQRSPREAEALLIARGIPAHAVQHSTECAADPQLLHLGHFAEIPHTQHGTIPVETSTVMLSDTPASFQRSAPLRGEHTLQILRDFLGYDDARIEGLTSSGALD